MLLFALLVIWNDFKFLSCRYHRLYSCQFLLPGENVFDICLPAESIFHTWLLPGLSLISCFLPETAMHDKWLPARSIHLILLLGEAGQEAQSLGQFWQEAYLQGVVLKGRKRLASLGTDSLARKQKLAD